MSGKDRRTFLKQSATALSAAALTRCAPAEDSAVTSRLAPEGESLRALGESILPGELGADGIERVVSGFEAWLADYEPVPELSHGYGSSEIRYGPPDPAPRWASQLEALELESRKRNATSFADLPVDGRRDLVRGHLTRHPTDRIGDPVQAQHLAVGLMSYFYASAEATDLCYGARIQALSCRGLEGTGNKPAPLEREG